MGKLIKVDSEYREWLADVKQRVRQNQIKAAVRVNSSMLELYWSIGADIVEKQAESKWGSGVIPQLSKDLRDEFTDVQGFSKRNLGSMKKFYMFYSQCGAFGQRPGAKISGNEELESTSSILHQVGAKSSIPPLLGMIPWRHHIEIMSRSKSVDEALFYVRQTIENGWSRAVLLNFISVDLYSRKGSAPNNFSLTLPDTQSDLAAEMLKDPYNFDFLALTLNYKEKELEDALTENITKFLIELGQGFAYVGRQVPIKVGETQLFLDLLFYHLKLRCFIVIELKATKFEAEHAGKLGVYVTAINHQLKADIDNPTIGLIVCKSKDKIMAEYAVESSSQPIGISEYELSKLLPDDYKSSLPSVEEIEEELKDTAIAKP
jgi:predicted nuclease of restriction endonuclease-like (RecB) superfamily